MYCFVPTTKIVRRTRHSVTLVHLEMQAEMHVGPHVKCPKLLSDLIKNVNCKHFVVQNVRIILRNTSFGSPRIERRTDRQGNPDNRTF